jgi:hypothetical protein
MSRPGFYNENRNRAFPFLQESVGVELGPGLLALPDGAVADCGFVMGVNSEFSSSANLVFLEKVVRSGNTFYFHFGTDALPGSYLVFTRQLTDEDYETEYAESDQTDFDSLSDSTSAAACDEPLWSGYMVSGRITSLEEILPSDGEVSRSSGQAVVEPALVQNLAGTYVKMLAFANQDRTRVEAPPECPEIDWPYETGVVHVNNTCVQGEVVLRVGYNATLRQDATGNAVVLGASPGAGAGEPCEEVSLFSDEVPPEGSGLLTGGPGCNDVLRSFNGVGGRLFNFKGGAGVTVEPATGENKVIIDADLAGMVACDDGSVISVSESV